MTRTPWYPASVKPVRVGWYEYWIPYLDTDWVMAFWTGETWLERVPGRELLQPLEPLPDGQWRGLAQPSGQCKCDLRTRLVGDGCQYCNPKLAAELASERREG